MSTIASNQYSLLRCADAAGYGAVSMLDEDATRPKPKKRPAGARVWRAALVLIFAIL